MKTLTNFLIIGLGLLMVACEGDIDYVARDRIVIINSTESEVKLYATDYTGETLWLIASPHDTAYSDWHFGECFLWNVEEPSGLVVADSVLHFGKDNNYAVEMFSAMECPQRRDYVYTLPVTDIWVRAVWDVYGDGSEQD